MEGQEGEASQEGRRRGLGNDGSLHGKDEVDDSGCRSVVPDVPIGIVVPQQITVRIRAVVGEGEAQVDVTGIIGEGEKGSFASGQHV